jgi:hypothetical protein
MVSIGRRLLLLLAAALMALILVAGPALAAPGNGQGGGLGMEAETPNMQTTATTPRKAAVRGTTRI